MHATIMDTLGILNLIFVLKNPVHCLHALTLVESSQPSILPHFCMNRLELLIAIKKSNTFVEFLLWYEILLNFYDFYEQIYWTPLEIEAIVLMLHYV